MSLNFSQIKELLSLKADTSQHRHVFILAGEANWQNNNLQEILSGYEEETLWVGESESHTYPFVSPKKAQSWLGREKKIVVFDANNVFDADGFAAISGIVVGGGLFILLMPSEDKWNEAYASVFGQRLIKSIQSSSKLNVVRQDDEKITFSTEPEEGSQRKKCDLPFLTIDQQHVVERMEKEVQQTTKLPVVLISDRGRGKSAALGITAARLLQKGVKNIVITAPRLRATEIVFKHIEQLLPEAELKRGQVSWHDSVIQFYPPDQLQQQDIDADLILVDEAAAIPVPLLTSYLKKFPQCIFATTVHGYEGTGRGFSVRFNKVLNKEKPGWIKLQMQTPIRWAENDPLEQWMFSLLCLDAEIADKNTIDKVDKHKLEITVLDKKQLAENELLLNEIIALLVLAHYRTQPSDLQRILDNEEISLFVAKYHHHIVAVTLVNHEGKFSEELSSLVYQGQRRPSGHLLAQALTYHCGIEYAATLNYSRIMRIAVHPELQGQGIGSALLNYVIQYEQKQGRDALGVSFGLNTELLKFWNKLNFSTVRIGFTREQTSGEHAAIMLLPLSQQGELVYQQAHDRFIQQCPYWFDDVLIDLSEDIKNCFKVDGVQQQGSLNDNDKLELDSYLNSSRNFELCIASINKFVHLNYYLTNESSFPYNLKKVLHEKIMNKKDWKTISNEMKLDGKKSARQLFYKAIMQLQEKNYGS